VHAISKKISFAALVLAALTLLAGVAVVAAATDPVPSPSLSLTASPAAVVYGQTVTLKADVGLPGASLTLSRMRAGESAYTTISSKIAGASGAATWSVSPGMDTSYRVDYAGGSGGSAAQADAQVTVAPRLTLLRTAPGRLFMGREAKLKLHVAPAHPGATIELQQWDKATKTWVAHSTLTLDSASTVKSTWGSAAAGKFKLRAVIAADATHAAGFSPVLHLQVFDPRNPYGVPTGPAHYIVVDRSQYKLYYMEHGILKKVFDCVLGRPSLPTPLGHFRIYAKDPHMSGPYGPRRMRYLGEYAIHGTDEPWLLNRFPRNYSHGCTRLSNAHILWLFSRVTVGTPVWNVP
jgi:lipoprotein-anchoring transpeptidase ErfK/SrfK